VRDLIHDFHASRYASCLAHLAALRPALALDIHAHDHAAVGFWGPGLGVGVGGSGL
jgi:hypothetical protein